jgi:murein DD-endopeptidase MepM/ murein hydrolase activator NlpD
MKHLLKFLLSVAVLLSTSCGTLQTPEFVGPGRHRSPSGVPMGRTSIVDDVKLRWPVSNPRITQGFITGAFKHRHQGIDLGGTKNTSIFAAHDGKVIYVGKGFKGYGKIVMIENPNGFASFYAHLNSINTKEGKWVTAGEKIGGMGRTGHATGVHLHFELRIGEIAVDPMSHFPTHALVNNNP